jgi:hypothetical protein
MAEFWQNKEGSETAQVKSMIDTCGLHNKIFTSRGDKGVQR